MLVLRSCVMVPIHCVGDEILNDADRFGSSVKTSARAKDRKSTRLNSSHLVISYAVFCLKKKHRHYEPPHRPWYPGKTQASFADMLATLRDRSVRAEVLSMRLHGRGSRNVVNALLHSVKLAA